MNIFYTSDCPIECAKNLDDKRVVKMCLETAQMLSTALRINGVDDEKLYKSTHKNHPSNVWVRECQQNYDWTVRHFQALCAEYKARYKKTHASYTKLNDVFEFYVIHELFLHNPSGKCTSIPNCAANADLGISFKHIKDTVLAYMLYLAERWENDKRTPTWYGVAK